MRKQWFFLAWIGVAAAALILAPAGAIAQSDTESDRGIIDDITEEVLTGPSDLDPEKILGPGGVSIETGKDILMSFGATVRFIPTSESNWDFGLSDEVGGYINTEPLKAFAGSALSSANAAKSLSEATTTFENALSDDRGVSTAFEEFANALNNAEGVLGAMNPAIGQAADGAAQLQASAASAGDLAGMRTAEVYMGGLEAAQVGAAQYQAAIQAQNTDVAGAALAAIAQNPDYQAAVAAGDMATAQAVAGQVAMPYVAQAGVEAAAAVGGEERAAVEQVFANPDYQAAMAAGNTAGAEAVAQRIVVGAVAQESEAAASGVIRDNADPALVNGASQIVDGVTARIMRDNPNATIEGAAAYATVLKAQADSYSPYYLADTFMRTHSNESGSVNDGYIRNETKMYFNAMAPDKKWSFYGALEFDRPIDTATVDNRGGKIDSASNFGLERLNASIELVPGLRFHAGWDVWGLDIIEAASMVYGDDNAGFWIKGDRGPFHYSMAWLKLEENDFQIDAADHTGSVDEDRDLLAAYVDYKIRESNKFRMFYAYDRIRNVPATDLLGAMSASAGLGEFAGINGGLPSTDAHNIGGYYLGKFGMVEVMGEACYKLGSADNTGLKGVDNGVGIIEHDDFDIASYAMAFDVGVELKDTLGWMSFKPHFGMLYTSGDDDPNDDTLGGYSGVTNAQRFSGMWGGENTIIGDTNFVLGTALYGYVPEFYGNGTPVFVGGLQNFAGKGNGRGDNPGLTMVSLGLTMRPKIFLIYRTNFNFFNWNEDFYVTNMVDPITTPSLASGQKVRATRVNSGFVGTEWDNEVTLALSKHMFIKGQLAFFFPGEGVEDVTAALSGGADASDTATRLGAELIWNF